MNKEQIKLLSDKKTYKKVDIWRYYTYFYDPSSLRQYFPKKLKHLNSELFIMLMDYIEQVGFDAIISDSKFDIYVCKLINLKSSKHEFKKDLPVIGKYYRNYSDNEILAAILLSRFNELSRLWCIKHFDFTHIKEEARLDKLRKEKNILKKRTVKYGKVIEYKQLNYKTFNLYVKSKLNGEYIDKVPIFDIWLSYLVCASKLNMTGELDSIRSHIKSI